MPRLAANLTMLFAEAPFLDRFARAAAAGFSGVEFLFPYTFEVGAIAAALARHGLAQALFNLPPGDWERGERGLAGLPGRTGDFRASLAQALDYAAALGCPRLHCMAGRRDDTVSRERQLGLYRDNVAWAAERCAAAGVRLLIEPLNPVDMPGYLLDDFGLALGLIGDIARDGGAAPGLQFDLYHCARLHGDVVAWMERAAAVTGHYQIAGVPERHEPDRGGLPLADVLAAVDRLHPELWVGCEYHPAAATEAGLAWARPFLPRPLTTRTGPG